MENLCILTRFDVAENSVRFEPINSPEDLYNYHVCFAGNFIFITGNAQYTVRFSLKDLKRTEISETHIREWIGQVKKQYPHF